MTTRIAICPGSYDPVTMGHVDIIRRAAAMFDHVVVGVVRRPKHKEPLIPAEDRVALVNARYRDFYPALADLRAQGVIGAIGLGVNEWQVCESVARVADIDCVLLAGRYTLLEQEPLANFLPFCQKKSISVIAGGVFNSGILATGPKPGAYYNYAPAPPKVLERASALERVCQAHSVPLAAAALRFPLAHPSVAGVVVGARTAGEVRSNQDLLARPIPPALWADLKAERLIAAAAPTS